MYTQAALDSLKDRIGFGDKGNVTINIDAAHLTGSTGRLFSGFHKLVTLENLFDTIDIPQTVEAKFNAMLAQLKVDAVHGSVIAVLDMNDAYQDSVDYSDTLTTKANLFDEVIGCHLALAVIEQLVTSFRINDSERMASVKYDKLKIELEGITDENGKVIAKGVKSKLTRAVRKVTQIIFIPVLPIENGSDMW